MQDFPKKRSGLALLVGVCGLAVSLGLGAATAGAQEATAPDPAAASDAGAAPTSTPKAHKPAVRTKKAPHASSRKAPAKAAERYFIEFRSRYALTYGHTFLAHGRLNARGEIVESEIAGLHPAGEGPTLWMIGHILPVPSEVGPSDGDLEEGYISARYRIELSEDRYKEVVAYIRQLQASSPIWHAAAYNCNRFVGVVAEHMGLRTPNSIQKPQEFITNLRLMNTGAGIRQAAATAPSDN
jgi:hypothetical protein